MRINYKGNYSQITTAVEDANDVLNSEEFYTLITQHGDFNCSDFSSEKIANIIKNSKLEVEVKIYKPRLRYRKVLGYFVKNRPNNIFLNSRKIYRDTNSITNTIVHEYIHAVDNSNKSEIQFGHNCGSFDNTAPYIIGSYAELLIEGNDVNEISTLQKKNFTGLQSMCLTEEKDGEKSDIFYVEDHRMI